MSDPVDVLNRALADRYDVHELIGEGGMARVWRADDLKHGRQVAIKVLKPELAAIIGAERFLSEIRTTANLQHPHILPLYDSGEADGILYYVMPYIEGESLRDRLEREQQLSIEDAVTLTRSILSALDYAHRHDVIHRDIKPANILLHDGNALVSDFGIALAVTGASGDRMTETGLSLGTPHYMAPEQATAERDLTARADIYSVACMMYEMLTGVPPHTGPNAQSILVSILTEDASPVTKLRRSVPAHVAAAIEKALEKLPADRFASAGDFGSALGDPAFTYTGGATGVRTAAVAAASRQTTATGEPGWWSHTNSRIAVGVAVLALGVAGAALVAGGGTGAAASPASVTTRSLLSDPALANIGRQAEVSRDGSMFVFPHVLDRDGEHSHGLLLRSANDPEPRELPDSDLAGYPAFSPDGRAIAFADGSGTGLSRVSVSGGRPLAIRLEGPDAETLEEFANLHWGTDGFIYFDVHGAIARVPADGGVVERLLEAPGHAVGYPRKIPGTDFVLYTWVGNDQDEREVRLLDLSDGSTRTLVEGTDGRFVPPDLLFFGTAAQALFAVPFDPGRGEVAGTPVTVLDSVAVSARSVAMGLSDNGTLLYWDGVYPEAEDAGDLLVEVDSTGVERRFGISSGSFRTPRYHPEGGRIAVQSDNEIWTFDLTTGTRNRIEEEPSSNVIWSPDGERLAYRRYAPGAVSTGEIVVASPLGEEKEVVYQNDESPFVFPFAWTSDGDELIVVEAVDSRDILRIPLNGEADPIPYLTTDFNEGAPVLHPEGDWLAYETDATGEPAVFLRRYPEGTDPVRISLGRGVGARWSADGSRLMYRAGDTTKVAEVVRTASGVEVGERTSWFTSPIPGQYISHEFSPQGDRVMLVRRPDLVPGSDLRLTLVTNWLSEVREKLSQANGGGG